MKEFGNSHQSHKNPEQTTQLGFGERWQVNHDWA